MDVEAMKAYEKYGHFNSTHEVYAVLKEEVEEFWEIVKEKTCDGFSRREPMTLDNKKRRMIAELEQICSVADRAIKELSENEIHWV